MAIAKYSISTVFCPIRFFLNKRVRTEVAAATLIAVANFKQLTVQIFDKISDRGKNDLILSMKRFYNTQTL